LKVYIDSLINKKSDKNYLQNYLTFQYFPFFDYTETIIILYKERKFNPALILLRSLVEGHIRIVYYQTGDWKKKLAIAAKGEFDTKLATIKGLLDLIKDYPNLASVDKSDLKNIDRLQELKAQTEATRSSIIRSNSLDDNDKDIRSLEDMAKECDKVKLENAVPGHFQQMYNLEYRYLSPIAHLNMEGLESLIEIDAINNFVLSEFVKPEIILSESIGLCLALSKDLYDNKVIESEIPELIAQIEILCQRYLKE
jgi:hypothetical protein